MFDEDKLGDQRKSKSKSRRHHAEANYATIVEWGNGKPSERRRTKTREDIIQAAHALITDHGLEGVSIRAVADLTSYSPAALYRYFEGKEQLVDAVRAHCFEQLNAAILQAVMPLTNPTEQLLAGGLTYIRYAREHPVDYHLMFYLPPSAATQDDSHRTAMRALLFIVRNGIDSGMIRVSDAFDENAIVYQCWATVHGLAMLQTTVMQDEQATFDAVCEPILRKVIAGFSA